MSTQTSMNETILAVDDEPKILSAYHRNLGDKFKILTAEGPVMALSALKAQSFAVVLTDLKMPGMDGIELLKTVRDLQPEAVRVLISGHADLSDAVNSVNRAGIFQLLLKPCPSEQLEQSLHAAIEQHRLITAEKALLEHTLNGAIQTLTEILAVLDPDAFGLAQLRRRMARELALALQAPTWTFEIAAQLADIGRATLPPALVDKLQRRVAMNDVEKRLVERLPELSQRLLANIPRLEAVCDAVLYQNKEFNGDGFPQDDIYGDDIPLVSRALFAINSLIRDCADGIPPTEAVSRLKRQPKRFDPRVASAAHVCETLLRDIPRKVPMRGPQSLKLSELCPGMVLLSDVLTRDGMVVLGAESLLTGNQIQRMLNFAKLNPVVEPILVEYRD